MGERPPGASLDRIDNDGPYSPENCRWATRTQQQRNQRCTRHVTIEGLKYRAADLADISGLKTDTIVERANQGLAYNEVIAPDKRIFKDGLALGGVANGARQKAKTHCPNGHEYSPENTGINSKGWRRCRRCHADKENERRRKRLSGE